MALPSAGFDKSIYQAPAGDITGFTAIIDSENFSVDYWSDVNSSDGTRARFAKDTGAVEIAFDFIDFDDTGESGWARVFIGNSFAADSAATRTIRAYAPNTRNTAYAPSDTFGSDNAYDSDWLAYLPMTSDFIDRTSNGLDGTGGGGISAGDSATGPLGSATTFDGLDDDVTFASGIASGLNGASGCYFSVWHKRDGAGTRDTLIDLTVVGSSSKVFMEFQANNTFRVGGREASGASFQSQSSTSNFPDTVSYHKFSGILDIANDNVIMYRDSVTLADTGTISWTGTTFTNEVGTSQTIGEAADGFHPFIGKMADMQFHKTIRDADWDTQEFDQLDDNATFWDTWVFIPAGGVTHQLAGSIDSHSTLTGLLNLIQRLSASLNSSSHTSGVLRLIQRLSGSLNSNSIVSGTIRLIHGLKGAINSISALVGNIRLKIGLSGTVESHSQLSGNLSVPTTHSLFGSIESHSLLSGTLTEEGIVETLLFNIDRTETLSFDIDTTTEIDYNIDRTEEIDFDIDTE